MQKLLILDGIGGVPLGREMHESFVAQGVSASYYDCAKLPKIQAYDLRSGFAKLINRADCEDTFYHLPRLKLSAIKALIEKEKPTHVLVIGFIYKFIAPQALQTLKNQFDFSLYLYDTDSCNLYAKRREFIFFIEHELPIYDEIFSFSKVTSRFFSETKKLNASFFPFGANPINLPLTKSADIDVLFVGSCDLRRIFLLEHIRDVVNIYGDRWSRNQALTSEALLTRVHDQGIWGDTLYAEMAKAKIVLNITRSRFYGAETGVSLRVFEALAAGCFLLTDYCDELADLFVIGEEIEVFRSARELREKVDYYLAHPDRRAQIAEKGKQKLLQQYTWSHRAKAMLNRMAGTT